jgi:hypothetical protein
MAQMVEHFSSKHEALNINANTAKMNKQTSWGHVRGKTSKKKVFAK